jgi:ribonuclease P protein component
MFGRLVDASDFKRVLASAPVARSAHFALHHVAAAPAARRRLPAEAVVRELSTMKAPTSDVSVDKLPPPGPAAPARWAGFVLPKRLARRAVTRQLLKRQMRQALLQQAAFLPAGMWVVRLRAAFATSQFPSAASDALRAAARAELQTLLRTAAAR